MLKSRFYLGQIRLGDQVAARYVTAFGPLLSFDVAGAEEAATAITVTIAGTTYDVLGLVAVQQEAIEVKLRHYGRAPLHFDTTHGACACRTA